LYPTVVGTSDGVAVEALAVVAYAPRFVTPRDWLVDATVMAAVPPIDGDSQKTVLRRNRAIALGQTERALNSSEHRRSSV